MASYNKVILIGNLTRDPELTYLPSGTALAKFGIAMNESYTDKQSGEKKEDVCFVDITAWARTAEVCNEYLKKGNPVFIDGKLTFNSWETDDGQKRSKLEVVAQRVQLIGGRPLDSENGSGGEDDTTSAAPPSTEDAPAVADDDIPF